MSPGNLLVGRPGTDLPPVLVVHVQGHEFMGPDITVWGFDAEEPFVEVLSYIDAISKYEVDNG